MNAAAVQVFLCAVTVTSLWTISMGRSCNFVEQFTLNRQTTCEQSRKQKQTKKNSNTTTTNLDRNVMSMLLTVYITSMFIKRNNKLFTRARWFDSKKYYIIINALTLCVNMRRILLSSANVGQQQNRVMNRCHHRAWWEGAWFFHFNFLVGNLSEAHMAHSDRTKSVNFSGIGACPIQKQYHYFVAYVNFDQSRLVCWRSRMNNAHWSNAIQSFSNNLLFRQTNRVRPFNMYWMIGHFRVQNCVINVINHYQMINQESLIAATPVKWSRIISIQT